MPRGERGKLAFPLPDVRQQRTRRRRTESSPAWRHSHCSISREFAEPATFLRDISSRHAHVLKNRIPHAIQISDFKKSSALFSIRWLSERRDPSSASRRLTMIDA